MRHLKSGRKLSRRSGHRGAMLSNLAASLILHEKVRTTDAKAKEVRPFVERLITFARRGDLHARRVVLARLGDPKAVKKLFDEVGPRFKDRLGGYTRILKLGFRLGDNAPISLIELVGEEPIEKAKPKRAVTKSKTTKKKTPTKQAAQVSVEEPVSEASEEAPATPEPAAEPVEDTTGESGDETNKA